MEFATKSSLEQEIDHISTRVRDLQAAVRKNVDGVTLDDVREQITRLIELRKELQLWEEEQGFEGNQVASPTSSTSDNKKRRKHKKRDTTNSGESIPAAEELVESESNQSEAKNDDLARAQQRLVELESVLAKGDEQIARLEEGLKREERSQKTLEFLKKRAAKRDAGRKEQALMPAAVVDTTSSGHDELEKLQVVNNELKTKVEHAKAVQQAKELELATLAKSVETLTKKNVVLEKAVKEGEKNERLLRSEVARLETSIREAQEAVLESKTNFGSLWKSVDDAKSANVKLEERNVQLELELKTIRSTFEKAEKERTMLEMTRMAELEAKIHSNDQTEVELKAKLAALEAANNALSTQLADSNIYNTRSKEHLAVIERKLVELQEQQKTVALERDELASRLLAEAAVHATTKAELDTSILKLQEELTRANKTAIEAENRLIGQETSYQTLITERDQAIAEIRELKDQIMAANVERERAVEVAAISAIQIQELEIALKNATKQTSTVSAKLASLNVVHAKTETEFQNLRIHSASQEEMLKKMRASLLEANVELKDLRAGVQKWKTTAQNATSRLTEKTSEAENTRKQLGRTRSELTAISTLRQQLSESSKAKERKISTFTADIQALKEKISTIERTKASLLKENNDALSKIETLLKEKAALTVKAKNADTYHQLLLTLIPVVVAALLYGLMK